MGRGQAWPTQRLFNKAVIADPHLVVAQGVARLLSSVVRSIKIVGSGEELIDTVRFSPPGLVISEVYMPGMNGIDAMRLLHGEGLGIPFAFLTISCDSSTALKAMRAGASAYLPKTVERDELLTGLEDVAGGRAYIAQGLRPRMVLERKPDLPVLTATQLRILHSICKGVGTRELAAQLGISIRTVESHKYLMMQELKAHTTVQLLIRAREAGLIDA